MDEQELREENRRLREELDAARQGLSRRSLLLGGAGVAAAGAGLLGARSTAVAAGRQGAAAPALGADRLPLTVPPPYTTPVYFTVLGRNQGQIQGGVIAKGHVGAMLAYQFELASSLRYDASGMPTPFGSGKTYAPVQVTKPWDQASPHLLTAFFNREPLTVKFQFYGLNSTGVVILAYSVELDNAFLVEYDQQIGNPQDVDEGKTAQVERLSFTFETIQARWWYPTSFAAMDHWYEFPPGSTG